MCVPIVNCVLFLGQLEALTSAMIRLLVAFLPLTSSPLALQWLCDITNVLNPAWKHVNQTNSQLWPSPIIVNRLSEYAPGVNAV
jgi:hypothetical protein